MVGDKFKGRRGKGISNTENNQCKRTETMKNIHTHTNVDIYTNIYMYTYIHRDTYTYIHIRYDETFTMMANKLGIKDQNPGIELLKNKRLNSTKESSNNTNRAPETKISVVLRRLSPDLEWS